MHGCNGSALCHSDSMQRITLLLAVFCFAMSSGFLSGRLIATRSTPITFPEDTRPSIPVITIEGVRNGLLYGEITGNARVSIGKEIFTQSGMFTLDAAPLLRNEISVVIPAWAGFVASKNGKKYYPVDSASGRNIVPKNRVYFASPEAAETAGYVR